MDQPATTLGLCSPMASARRSNSNTVPHSVSMVTTSPPTRRQISASSGPNRPKLGTRTLSPGDTSDPRQASIPARAVPFTSKVHSLVVRYTWR